MELFYLWITWNHVLLVASLQFDTQDKFSLMPGPGPENYQWKSNFLLQHLTTDHYCVHDICEVDYIYFDCEFIIIRVHNLISDEAQGICWKSPGCSLADVVSAHETKSNYVCQVAA